MTHDDRDDRIQPNGHWVPIVDSPTISPDARWPDTHRKVSEHWLTPEAQDASIRQASHPLYDLVAPPLTLDQLHQEFQNTVDRSDEADATAIRSILGMTALTAILFVIGVILTPWALAGAALMLGATLLVLQRDTKRIHRDIAVMSGILRDIEAQLPYDAP